MRAPQHRLAVHYLIAACASLAERFCNRKELSRISVTRSFLLHKKKSFRLITEALLISILLTIFLILSSSLTTGLDEPFTEYLVRLGQHNKRVLVYLMYGFFYRVCL